MVYREKPDLRNLLPMFSVCYLRRRKSLDDTKIPNSQPHSLAAILVGRSNVSNSPLFFHPHTQKLITTDDFYMDESIPAGPTFDISYNNGIHFNSYAELNAYLKPPTFKPDQTLFLSMLKIYTKKQQLSLSQPVKITSTQSNYNMMAPFTNSMKHISHPLTPTSSRPTTLLKIIVFLNG